LPEKPLGGTDSMFQKHESRLGSGGFGVAMDTRA
jgi:hypothetical protein